MERSWDIRKKNQESRVVYCCCERWPATCETGCCHPKIVLNCEDHSSKHSTVSKSPYQKLAGCGKRLPIGSPLFCSEHIQKFLLSEQERRKNKIIFSSSFRILSIIHSSSCTLDSALLKLSSISYLRFEKFNDAENNLVFLFDNDPFSLMSTTIFSLPVGFGGLTNRLGMHQPKSIIVNGTESPTVLRVSSDPQFCTFDEDEVKKYAHTCCTCLPCVYIVSGSKISHFSGRIEKQVAANWDWRSECPSAVMWRNG